VEHAHSSVLQVKYTSVAGRFIKGAELSGDGSLLAKIAGIGYQQVWQGKLKWVLLQMVLKPIQ